MTADGVEIAYQSTRCIYRQGTGANTTLSLQIQYLDSPDTVAFAFYIDDPPPAHPFRATPSEAPLELARGSVPLDCEASYDESLSLE
jgi:hypothetical protein